MVQVKGTDFGGILFHRIADVEVVVRRFMAWGEPERWMGNRA